MIKISFPGGCGGNWLVSTITRELLSGARINFHQHQWSSHSLSIKLVHELDTANFDYLYSGASYFNFYLNVIYKFFHVERNIFAQHSYQDYFLESVNTARFVCKFSKIQDHIWFDFDQLVTEPDRFFKQLTLLQEQYQLPVLSDSEFDQRRSNFLNTCVDPSDVFENFNHLLWVTFVLGQLMEQDIVPSDFVIYKQENFQLCSKFAQQHYQKCVHTKFYNFNTKVFLPRLLQS
jgi:hypothetical protein